MPDYKDRPVNSSRPSGYSKLRRSHPSIHPATRLILKIVPWAGRGNFKAKRWAYDSFGRGNLSLTSNWERAWIKRKRLNTSHSPKVNTILILEWSSLSHWETLLHWILWQRRHERGLIRRKHHKTWARKSDGIVRSSLSNTLPNTSSLGGNNR